MPLDTVYLENQTWNRVTVEAVIGNKTPPEANRSLGSRVLTIGASWQIDSNGEDIYYHRDANPDNPDGRMTIWNRRPCFGQGEVYHEKV